MEIGCFWVPVWVSDWVSGTQNKDSKLSPINYAQSEIFFDRIQVSEEVIPMKRIALVLLTLIMAFTLSFSTPVEAGTKKSGTKYSSSYKKNNKKTTKKNSKSSYKKSTKKSSGSGSYKKSSGKKSSKKSCQEWPDCDDYWDEDEFLDDWDGNMPDDSDAMDYWDNW